MYKKRLLSSALQASTPVFFGYISIGLVFGFLLVKAGFSWGLAPFMSITVFAGAAQYLAIDLLNQQTALIDIFITIFLLNARHIVYGLSLLDRFNINRFYKNYLIFGLTDETYGLLTTLTPPDEVEKRHFYLIVTSLNHLYWIIGSILGALIGNIIPTEIKGLEFALIALFIVLLVEQIKKIKRVEPFIIPMAIFFIFYFFGLDKYILILSIILSSIAMFFIKEK